MAIRSDALLGVVLAAVATVWLAHLIAITPFLILVAAVVPAAVYAVVIGWRGGGSFRRPAILLGCVLWGATAAAFLSRTGNEAARAWIEASAGAGESRALASTIVAPLVEESAKAVGLLLLLVARGRLVGVRDGIVYGALIGVGFVLAENLVYFGFAVLQGGPAGLARNVYVRGVLAGANHAIFTATIGAGLGIALRTRDTSVRVLALTMAGLAALAQHVAWNALASDAISGALCGAETIGGACRASPASTDLFLVVPLLVALFLGPGAAMLLYLAARDQPGAQTRALHSA